MLSQVRTKKTDHNFILNKKCVKENVTLNASFYTEKKNRAELIAKKFGKEIWTKAGVKLQK